MKKPNIILFITHDQGQLIGCYNSYQMPNSLKTPNLNQLAENGVRFINHFCTAPQCSPSRGSIQTSLYPHQNGLMGLVNRGWTLPKHNKTLAMYLKENGYTTHLIGLQHESKRRATLGYDTKSKTDADFNYLCKNMEEEILDFFSEHKDDDTPFYVCIGTFEVHIPFKNLGVPVDPNTVKIPPFLIDNSRSRKDLSELYGAVHTVDEMIGKIIKSLESNGLLKETLFIFTTDHGIALPRAKCTLYDPGIKTALIMSQPSSNLFNEGRIFDCMVSNIDLLPTILDYIGSKIPKNIEGRSFLPVLKGEKIIFRNKIFTEKSWHDKYDPIRAIRTEKFKYIKNFEKIETQYLLPLDISVSTRIGRFIQKRMKDTFEIPRAEEELYDLENDPNELTNLISNPAYYKTVSEMRTKLNNWMERTNDPLLKGKIPHPRGQKY